jgi:hypothetical protein
MEFLTNFAHLAAYITVGLTTISAVVSARN